MTYHVDRFHAAVSVLAGDGHIKQRLAKAYQDNLEEISEDELPAAVQQGFSTLRNHLHRVTPTNGEGPICASVRKMSADEASRCAESLVCLYGELIRCADDAREPEPLPEEEHSEPVPTFLIKSVS